MKIEQGKIYITRDGRKARISSIDACGERPIVGHIESFDRETLFDWSWSERGCGCKSEHCMLSDADIVACLSEDAKVRKLSPAYKYWNGNVIISPELYESESAARLACRGFINWPVTDGLGNPVVFIIPQNDISAELALAYESMGSQVEDWKTSALRHKAENEKLREILRRAEAHVGCLCMNCQKVSDEIRAVLGEGR